ncbi:hypothetical protein KJ359_M000027 (mitochondrion) [Pestalotiopsis sp. 9143b]|nr:hypothetical protein KJ359_M000073 [Pestalotiopsis sp. 9143b]KAI4591417.1 hypothetical protein KJ359_M000027 [Pestalotiopsis sp. 9143b]
MNFNGTLSNKYSTVASFVEHYTSKGVSDKIFHFDPFTTKALSSSMHFLNSMGSYSICIKGILSVGCFVLISNHLIPFINKIFQKLKGIMSKFWEKLIMYIKSTPSGQNSSRGSFNQNSSRVSSNNDVNRPMYASTSSGGNNGGGEDDEDEFNKKNPRNFPLSPPSSSFLTKDELAMLTQILRQLLEDIRLFNGWSTATGSPNILNRISVFSNGNLSRLNTLLNSLEERIDLYNLPAYYRVVLLTHSLRIVVTMLNRMYNQFRTIPLWDLEVTRLPYFTLPHLPRDIYWPFNNAWFYMHRRYDPLVYTNIGIDNLRGPIHQNYNLIYSQTYIIRILEYILNILL